MTATETAPKVVSMQEWLQSRKALLEQEKAFTHRRDELSRARRELPWVEVDQNYVFDSPDGPVTLADLFQGRSQLMIYHFMFGPEWKEGCPSCSMVADNIDGALIHLEQRDVTLVMVSRAPIWKIEPFRLRMGWNVRWVSSFGNSFNRDFHVSFTKEEMERGEVYYNFGLTRFPADEAQGLSVFCKDANGAIFHTYSSYGRGVEGLLSTYDLLDMAPKGRDEDELPHPMAWIRHHDRYPQAEPAHSCCSVKERS